MKPNADHFRILDALEERESALLSWGDVDGYFTSDELQKLDRILAKANLPKSLWSTA